MIDELEDNSNEIWEPEPLQLGAVVRIRIHVECDAQIVHEIQHIGRISGGNNSRHPRIYNNEVGIIVQINNSDEIKGHYYRVFVVRSLETSAAIELGSDFAGAELEYVERHLSYREYNYIATNCRDMLGCDPPNWVICKVVEEEDEDGNMVQVTRKTCRGNSNAINCYGHGYTINDGMFQQIENTYESAEKT